MNIEQKVNDIATYFKNKIIEGDFEFKECGDHTATVIVDEKYNFKLWIANDPKQNFDFYDCNFIIDNSYEFFMFKTQKERIEGWNKIKPHVLKYKREILIAEKQKEINKLNEELSLLD